MPRPVVKRSEVFRQAIPGPLRGLYDYLVDDPLGGLSPTPVAIAAGKSLPPAVRTFINMLRRGPSSRPILEEAAASRVTPRLAYGPTRLYLPEGLELAPGISEWLPMPARLRELHAQQRAFDVARRRQTPMGVPNPYNPYVTTSRRSVLGSDVTREIKLGIETPAVKRVEDLPVAAAAGMKPARQAKYRSLSQVVRGGRGVSKRAKLTDEQVRNIRKMASEGYSIPEISERYPDISKHGLGEIVQRMSYQWVK